MKWYHKALLILCVIAFSPIIIFAIVVESVRYLFELPKNKKEYAESRYFKDFNLPFKRYILYSPEYRFYNNIKKRNLQVNYTRQESNGLEYFVYENVLYLFPDFEQIDYNEEKAIWEVDYDGDWKTLEEAYRNTISQIDNSVEDYDVKLLVERNMCPMTDLNGVDIPECIFLTWSYENAFENEDSPLKRCIPVNTTELYEMMNQTADLCGKYKIADNGNILWDLYDNIQIEIGVNPGDCYIGVNRKQYGKVKSNITHWHPTIFEVYGDVCKMGKLGNVLVIRSFLMGETVLYSGDKGYCPYEKYKKQLGKIYYLEAR